MVIDVKNVTVQYTISNFREIGLKEYLIKKSPPPTRGYCGYIYELSNHLNTSFNSSAPVRVFSGGRILRLQKIFSKTLSSFWQSKKSPVLSREKGRYYRLSAERR